MYDSTVSLFIIRKYFNIIIIIEEEKGKHKLHFYFGNSNHINIKIAFNFYFSLNKFQPINFKKRPIISSLYINI